MIALQPLSLSWTAVARLHLIASRIDDETVWPYHPRMAKRTIKCTYSLDPRTVDDLEQLARRFGTSKSEILRRAVQVLARQETTPEAQSLQALERLQNGIALSSERAGDWAAQVRRERAEMGRDRTDG